MPLRNYKKKVVGRKVLSDDNGELHTAIFLAPNAVDKNFTKVFHKNLIDRLENPREEITAMKKSMNGILLFWKLVEMMGYDNHIRATQERIAEELGVSPSTVKRFIGDLEKADIMICVGHGDFMISPEIVAQVGNEARIEALNEWFRRRGQDEVA